MAQVFLTEDNKEIKSAGIIFYAYKKKKTYLLLQNDNERWCDLGGKKDKEDTCPEDIAAREAAEESNCCFVSSHRILDKEKVIELLPKCQEYLKSKIVYQSQSLYLPKSKYMLYFVRISNKEKVKLKKNDFSNVEFFSNIEREMDWISLNKYKELLLEKKIHVRLNDKNVTNYLNFLNSIIK
ncbi:hypothetical protein CPAV1605_287 [seawater metagenome]|uniref:Uncharacterized protein n=1 Tax=seawater metagenome TaxID=1561972 RepID=A0A5E8CLD8_9ZZZZ